MFSIDGWTDGRDAYYLGDKAVFKFKKSDGHNFPYVFVLFCSGHEFVFEADNNGVFWRFSTATEVAQLSFKPKEKWRRVYSGPLTFPSKEEAESAYGPVGPALEFLRVEKVKD